ncbi:hypothetical protein [Oceanihabitans sediminis]|uniref:hypothetical protein n=1 Tax=Oceanihabitans sediminis TaxID=1812012 RepID=UPI00299F0A80|nr:hypothetical protein [Oceanihabitans sediminis]MDX1279382.1 hypothetical protein [Oceanihabitans sediminis]
MNPVFSKIRETETPTPRKTVTSLLWVNQLIKSEIDVETGSVTSIVLKSFTRPAKDSDVKRLTKPKKEEKPKLVIPKVTKAKDKVNLFD